MDAGGREEPRHLRGWGPETRGMEQPSVKMGVHGDGWGLGCVVYTHVKLLRKISGSGVQEREVWPGASRGWHQGRNGL